VDDDGATLDDPTGSSLEVAVGADANAATGEFLRILNGGALPEIPDGSPEEHAYFDELEAGFVEFATLAESVQAPTGSDAHAEADHLLEAVSGALQGLASAIDSVDPPTQLTDDHEQLSIATDSIVGQMDGLRAAVAATEGDDAFVLISLEIIDTGLEATIDEMDDACASIAEYLVIRVGPLSCPGLGGNG
jgi:hypothetical protein